MSEKLVTKDSKKIRSMLGRNQGLMLFLAFSYGDLTKDLVDTKASESDQP